MQESWQPTATVQNLRQRAVIIQKIRTFFNERAVLEVETPLLCSATVTDPHLHSLVTEYTVDGAQESRTLYLQTSPEFAMKRLLAAGSGAIYQISKAFRNGESGRLHNPEFTLLEWYRPGFDHHALMDEVDRLLMTVLGSQSAERASYADVFKQYLEVNPHTATAESLRQTAIRAGLHTSAELAGADCDTWLQLLMTHVIEPQIGKERPIFVYDFPASQAALAKIRQDENWVAERFEVYFKGIELANGFHELTDVNEQEARFKADVVFRENNRLPLVPVDNYFLNALAHGLPQCAGVALGIDRLVMLAVGASNIGDVLAFNIENS